MLRSRVPLLGRPMPHLRCGGGMPWELGRGERFAARSARARRCNNGRAGAADGASALLQGGAVADLVNLKSLQRMKHAAGGRDGASPNALTIVTWLILPVVICLSQRLSHACLSISNLYRETANGSLNQLSFI